MSDLESLFTRRIRRDSPNHNAIFRESPPTYLRRLTIILLNQCNLRCTYCYEKGGSFGKTAVSRMTLETAKNALDALALQYKNIGQIMFFGGEPTLMIDMIKNICLYVRHLCEVKQLETAPHFGIITNGTIFNDEIASVLREYDIHVTISIDGPKKVHDKARKYRNGKGSYERVWQNFHQIKNAAASVGIEATINTNHISENVRLRDIMDHIDNAFGITNPHVTVASETADDTINEQYVLYYREAVQEFLEGVKEGKACKAFTWATDMLNAFVIGNRNECICPVGQELAIDPEGDLYPCFMFAGDEKYRIAHCMQKELDQTKGTLAMFAKKNLKSAREDCEKCWVRGLCRGCLGQNSDVTGDITKNWRQHCAIMKAMAEEIILFMYKTQEAGDEWTKFVNGYARMYGLKMANMKEENTAARNG